MEQILWIDVVKMTEHVKIDIVEGRIEGACKQPILEEQYILKTSRNGAGQ